MSEFAFGFRHFISLKRQAIFKKASYLRRHF